MDLILEKWETILNTVREEHELSDVSFKTWLLPLHPYTIKDNTLYILIASDDRMILGYLKKKYILPLKVAVNEITGKEYEIDFIFKDQTKSLEISKPEPIHDKTNYDPNSNLNPAYTFDTFVVGSNNRFAHSASLAVAESPGESYNPLFLYGGVGLGKTHLMHSIAHYIQANDPDKKVLYVTSETFTNELIDSIRNGNNSAMSKFREKYRNIDVLLVDDVQFIIGKESTQEEFFHTFNELHGAKKQIIISSDRPPKEMETLEERIRSRFEWGLIADIGSPDYETRMAILRRKEESDGVHIDDDVLSYISNNIKSNIRELEGALNKLIAYSHLENIDITMEIAKKELQNIISPDKPNEITPQLIIEVVSEHFQISVDEMISKKRSNKISIPRQIAMYLCRDMTDIPLETIGNLLGGRDHSTILHGTKKISDMIEEKEEFDSLIKTIKKKINPN